MSEQESSFQEESLAESSNSDVQVKSKGGSSSLKTSAKVAVEVDVLLGRAWEGGPSMDLNHVGTVSSEFERRQQAVTHIRLRMKHKSLPGYELRTPRNRSIVALLQRFSRAYLRSLPCIQVSLSDAVWDGDIIMVGEVMSMNTYGPDSRDDQGLLMISIAIEQKQLHIVKYLMDRGSNINLQDHGTLKTPLMHSIIMGNKMVARRFIEMGADLDLVDKENMSALIWAVMRGYLELVAQIIDAGGNVYHKDKNGWTALHIACFKNYVEIVEYLLEVVEVRLDNVDEYEFTPKMYAQMENNYEIVHLLEKVQVKGRNMQKQRRRGLKPVKISEQAI